MAESPSSNRGPDGPAAAEPARQLVLLRFSGELTTKAAPTRRRFVQQLTRNIRDALKSEGVGFDLVRTHNRLFVQLHSADRGLDALARIFGVQSLAPVLERPWQSLDDLVAAGVDIFTDNVRGRRFAVRARRVGDRRRIPVHSEELQRTLGAALAPHAAGVDLSNPEVTASIEVMPGRAYFFHEDVRAEGGLPLACEGRAVALVSGGFDSPVAAWQLMKRGVRLDYVFCNLGGRAHQLETLRVMDVIARRWAYGTRPRFHAVDFDELTRDLQAKVTTRYWQIVLKRLMLRVAEAIAGELGAHAIVTGDAMGQVSSQTLENLAVISAATPLPILRPLVGFNKDEIIALSRRVGTHDLSKQVGEYCAMVPSKPATRSTLATIEAEEASLDPHILARAIAERSVFDLRTLELDALERPELQTDQIPDGATVIDLRSKAAFQGWHYPDALFLDFQNALRVYPQLDASQQYVLYCEFGLKSGHLAELMRRQGLDASHFAGGLKALIAHAKERGLPTPELP